jgi:CheY-like chemotaxis protein
MQQSALEIERPDCQDRMLRTAESRSSEQTPRMLIVDDDPSVVRLVSDRCARMGFEVATAANGMQAYLKASRTKPDILVIDVNMPELDGLSVCAHLLAQDKAPVNLIVMTGSRNPETFDRCDGLGAFHARKGPNFWNDLEAALAKINPGMAGKLPAFGAAEESSPHIRRRPCVLLVDDDHDVNRFVGSRLGKCGIDAAYAADAHDAFRVACRVEPAVIVTDYFMPNGDAEYLLRRLRANKSTANIPVIVLSGRQLNEVADQRLRREIGYHPGAAHVLKKSEDNAALFETLKQFCGFEPVKTMSAEDWLRSCN